MANLPELKKGTTILIGVVAAVAVMAAVITLGIGAIRLGDIFSVLENTNPRVMGFLALPFFIVAVVIGGYWLSKREERMWKGALKKTRAAREPEVTGQESSRE